MHVTPQGERASSLPRRDGAPVQGGRQDERAFCRSRARMIVASMTEAGQGRPGVRAEPRLELRGIGKAYGSLMANDGIDLLVMPGERHAVIGENGAGKSTLMKVIYGMVRPDAGYMLWEGREAVVRTPSDAQA